MVRRRLLLLTMVAAPLHFAAIARAEDREREKEPTAILELGGASEWGLPGATSLGPSAALEFEPIREWLEIEAGVAPLVSRGRTEWETDLLFKKPFKLSDKIEFMIGAGPQWTFSREGTKTAAEFALDFMFWPTPDRKLGWFVEPAYSYSLSSGHERSLGVTAGLLIPIP